MHVHVYIFIDLSYVQDFVRYSIIYERLNCAIFGVVGILPLNYHMPYQNYLWVLEDLKLHCAIYNESMIYNLYICRCRLWLDIGRCCFKYVGTGSGTVFFTVFVWAQVLVQFFFTVFVWAQVLVQIIFTIVVWAQVLVQIIFTILVWAQVLVHFFFTVFLLNNCFGHFQRVPG